MDVAQILDFTSRRVLVCTGDIDPSLTPESKEQNSVSDNSMALNSQGQGTANSPGIRCNTDLLQSLPKSANSDE